MSRNFAVGAALLLSMVACSSTPTEHTGTEDKRIDGAPQSVDAHSVDMCVNDAGEAFVAWVDARDGGPDLWFNRSLDGGQSWLPTPVKINRGEGSVFKPSVACNADGVYVAWEDDRIGELENRQIFVSVSRDKGETWLEEDKVLNDDPEGLHMALGPQIIATAANEVYVTWYDSRNGAYDIYFSASVDGGATFRPPLRVDTDAPGSAYSAAPQISATDQGDIFIAWEDSRDGASDIYFARSDNGGSSFRTDLRLDLGDGPGAFNSFAPRIGSSEGGDVYVVWHDERNGVGRDIYVNYSANFGVNWQPEAIRIESTNPGIFNSIFPEVAVDGGVAHVAWQDERNIDGVYDIYYRTLEFGELGPEEVRVNNGNPPGNDNAVNVQVALDGGQVVFAWEDYRNDETTGAGEQALVDLYYNYLRDGVPTEGDFRIDSWHPGNTHKADVKMAAHGGKVYTAWTDDRGLTYGVYFQALELGTAANFNPVEQQ